MVRPTYEHVVSGKYPLTRSFYVCFGNSAEKPATGLVLEFLRFALSQEGQQLVAREGDIPLPAKLAAKQVELLKGP